jgi:hypothetical protein
MHDNRIDADPNGNNGGRQTEFLQREDEMSNSRGSKQGRGKDQRANWTRRPTNKRRKNARTEELSPEQRIELARQIEAKEFRGKPPSI